MNSLAERGSVALDTSYQLLPPLSTEEFTSLKESISERGVRVPVEYDEGGNILDGHHRVQACLELGVSEWPKVVREGLTEEDKADYVLELNLSRRHLTKEQRQQLVGRLREQGWSLRRIAERLGVSHPTVLADLQSGGKNLPPETVTGADGKEYPATKGDGLEPALEAIARAGAESYSRSTGKPLTEGMVKRSKEVLKEYVTTGHVDTGSGESSALWGSIVAQEYEAMMRQQTYQQQHYETHDSQGRVRPEEKERRVIATLHTGDYESYTPEKYIRAAREVMGAIDTDPASNNYAQELVQAKTFFAKENSGLEREWHGRVWLNPPYAYPLIQEFIDKLLTELAEQRTSEAILLTNNSTDTRWFHVAAKASDGICLTLGRINFYKRDNSITQPTNGQTFFYFGPNAERFTSVFAEYGLIVQVS